MQENLNKKYDFIIGGMGCAGLSLAIGLIKSDIPFSKILIVDKEQKNRNDRTWCFWTKEKTNWFDEIIFKRWNQLCFKSETVDLKFNIEAYQYCLIRGIDFYEYCLNKIKNDTRFEIIYDEIKSISTNSNGAQLATYSNKYEAKLIFNSAFRNQSIKPKHVNYVQHFKGWLVEFEKNLVNESAPIFMDFRVEQKNDCRFVYVIPHSKNIALIEYTGFSKSTFSDDEYNEGIENYIEKNYKDAAYKILETEKGLIPMHESTFVNPFGKNVINIGTAGGASKASSGYTFYFIQKQVDEIIEQLKVNPGKVVLKGKQKRFQYFDKVLLHVLDEKKIEAAKIFETLFKKSKVVDVLEFLNEESSLSQDLKIINSLPKKYFVLVGMKKLLA